MNEIFKHPAEQMRKRVTAVIHLIDIAYHLLVLQNFNLMSAITCLLCSNSQILSLHKTLRSLGVNASKKLGELEEISMKVKKVIAHAIPPLIPQISLTLRDLIYTEEVGKTWVAGEDGTPMLNLRKMVVLGKSLKTLKDAQDIPFLFKEHSQLQRYLNDSIIAGSNLDSEAIQAVLKYEE